MNVTAFLSALPALLAIVGFVIYQLIDHQTRGREITKQIIEKLRKESPQNASTLEKLPPRQIAQKLRLDSELQKVVSAQDITLLTQVSQQEFIKSIIAYCLIALLFVVGVVAYVYSISRPTPVALSGWHLESVNPEAKGLAVDLDDLIVTWKADGPSEDLALHLENIQTGRKTSDLIVPSSDQKLVFPAGSYQDVLDSRALHSVNRIRITAKSQKKIFVSGTIDLIVGVKLLALPVRDDSALWLSCLIDNSAIQNYDFDAKLVVWPKERTNGPISFGGQDLHNPKAVFPVTNFDGIDWHSAHMVYFGPDDPRTIRAESSEP